MEELFWPLNRVNPPVPIQSQVSLHGHVVLPIVVNSMETKNFNGSFNIFFRQKTILSSSRRSWCEQLEEACVETVDAQKMTKDLAICIHGLKKYEPNQIHQFLLID